MVGMMGVGVRVGVELLQVEIGLWSLGRESGFAQ